LRPRFIGQIAIHLLENVYDLASAPRLVSGCIFSRDSPTRSAHRCGAPSMGGSSFFFSLARADRRWSSGRSFAARGDQSPRALSNVPDRYRRAGSHAQAIGCRVSAKVTEVVDGFHE
jgi:hypothetical protein